MLNFVIFSVHMAIRRTLDCISLSKSAISGVNYIYLCSPFLPCVKWTRQQLTGVESNLILLESSYSVASYDQRLNVYT